MASSTSGRLPPPDAPGAVHVTISPLAGGFITLSDHYFVAPADPTAKRTVPSLAFLVTHPGTRLFGAETSRPFRMMFDLGLRRAVDRYPASLHTHLEDRRPYRLEPGVAAQLAAGGVDAGTDVDAVVLSHVHYDHHGDPEDFGHARFLVGRGALDVLAHGLGEGMGAHQVFVPDTLPAERSHELPALAATTNIAGMEWSWAPLGPFPAALDLFGDGAVYVIDTPGHLPGHVNLLCRTARRWVLLAGDAFHDRRLLTGEKEIGTWAGSDGETHCIHVDPVQAKASIARLRELASIEGDAVELVAAHDEEWWERNRENAFPNII